MSRARALDQFYTARPVAALCFKALQLAVEPRAGDFYLEPSAGDGAFFELLPKRHRLGLDLEPKHRGIQQRDFLDFVPESRAGRLITLGNPPWGRNTSLAVKFFNHAAEFSSVIAFIVPLTFRKDSLVHRLDPWFAKVLDLELDPEAFVFEGKPYSVPSCFQVWLRTDDRCDRALKPVSHPDFRFTKPGEADFAFRRVGRLAGKLLVDFSGYSPLSHHYLKADATVGPELLRERLGAIDWSAIKCNSAGSPSISKREFVEAYAAML